jgi:hypothetical protein
MRTFIGSIFAMVAATGITCSAIAAQGQDVEAQLKRVNAKYTKDAEGRLVAVELPSGARDYHLEALFDIPTITEVKAPRCRASFETAKQMVKHLPALSAVYFEGVENANDYVACLREAKNLKTLSVAGSTVTNHGLNDICLNHPDLRGLDISRTKVDTHGLAPLAKLRRLESLGLVGVGGYPEIERRDFAPIARLPSLKRLAVTGRGLNIQKEDLRVS